MILYDEKLLDAFQQATGFSDEKIDEWLLNRAVLYEKDIPAHDWHDDPDGNAYYVYLNVVSDITAIVRHSTKGRA